MDRISIELKREKRRNRRRRRQRTKEIELMNKILEKKKQYEEEIEKLNLETEEMERKMIERLEELKEMHAVERRNQALIDTIFDVFRNWTDIEFFFCHLVGVKDALNGADEESESVKRVRRGMMKKARLILKLHETVKKQIEEVMDSLDDLLDFVELGTFSNQRKPMILALTCMKNIEFWTLENETMIDKGIGHLKSKMDEVREHVRVLSLDRLRPRVSVRQRIQQHINSLLSAETRVVRSGSLFE